MGTLFWLFALSVAVALLLDVLPRWSARARRRLLRRWLGKRRLELTDPATAARTERP